MKNRVSLIMLLCLSGHVMMAQKVGVNMTTPLHILDVKEASGTTLVDEQSIINAEYTKTNNADVIAVKGKSTPADNWGIGGDFLGGYIGVNGHSIGASSGEYTGVKGKASGTGSGIFFGLYGLAFAQGVNCGVYGKATGGTTNWAGFFDNGDVGIQNRLAIGNVEPLHPVHINQPFNTTLYEYQPVVYAEYTGTNTENVIAIQGRSKPANNYGIGGYFDGGYAGVFGIANSPGDGSRVGVYGQAVTGTGTNIGVYGTALSGSTNWAGYFSEGNVYIKNNLGIGQPTPVMNVDILDAQAVTRLTSNSSSNGSVLELRNSTESPTNFGAINFGTANTTTGQIAYLGNDNFIIRVNSAERIRINALGLMGIGRLPFTNRLEVEGNASKSSAGDWLANSDARLKKNIEPLDAEVMIEKLLSLKGVTYEWNDDKTGSERPEGVQYGFTAQNIQEVFPTLVEEDAKGYLQTAYGTYDAMTVEAIRYLYKENQSLKSELEEIKSLLKQGLESK